MSSFALWTSIKSSWSFLPQLVALIYDWFNAFSVSDIFFSYSIINYLFSLMPGGSISNICLSRLFLIYVLIANSFSYYFNLVYSSTNLVSKSAFFYFKIGIYFSFELRSAIYCSYFFSKSIKPFNFNYISSICVSVDLRSITKELISFSNASFDNFN